MLVLPLDNLEFVFFPGDVQVIHLWAFQDQVDVGARFVGHRQRDRLAAAGSAFDAAAGRQLEFLADFFDIQDVCLPGVAGVITLLVLTPGNLNAGDSAA